MNNEQSAAEAAMPIATTVDKETYSIGLPEGWAVMSEDESGCFVYKGQNPAEAMDGAWVAMKIASSADETVEKALPDMVKEMGAKQLDDVTIGGKTFKQISFTEQGEEARILMADYKRAVSFTIMKATAADADVQAVVGSFKMK